MAPFAPREWRSPAAGPGRRVYAELRHRTLTTSLVEIVLPILRSPGHIPRDQPFQAFWTTWTNATAPAAVFVAPTAYPFAPF
jgi:hypothetical protein